MDYTCPQSQLLAVTEHAAALDIVIEALTLAAGQYHVSTDRPFPPEQLEHLALTEV